MAGTLIELPCIDRRRAAVMDRTQQTRMAGQRGERLVVALHPPIDGHCHKVVEAVLPGLSRVLDILSGRRSHRRCFGRAGPDDRA